MFDGMIWYSVKDGDPRAAALYNRHYSAVNLKARKRTGDMRIAGMGEKLILMTSDCKALFGWRHFTRGPDLAGQDGVCCFVFRNESAHLSSFLIERAEELAQTRWPGMRMFSYINPHKIKSSNPGYCFQMAGWEKCGLTKGGLIIMEKMP